ncbi:hypothetical protein BKA82DRAFT_4234151 [Pisolithus tinctorius]|nr:hypothetical protein BKA82DRAFT_4234151 [Pisolithus tinctorius]
MHLSPSHYFTSYLTIPLGFNLKLSAPFLFSFISLAFVFMTFFTHALLSGPMLTYVPLSIFSWYKMDS